MPRPPAVISTEEERNTLETIVHRGKTNLQRHALSRRLPDEAALRRQVSAVETERNTHKRGIAWQFTSRDACRKLERLYPVKACSSD